MYWLVSQKNGASALGLQKVLGLGSYKTAWTWLHKLRRAMVRPGRDRLTGRVEVEETYLGGLEEGVRGRQTEYKSSSCDRGSERAGYRTDTHAKRIVESPRQSMEFVKEAIEPGSTVHTDGWAGYDPLAGKGYPHDITFLKGRRNRTQETDAPSAPDRASLLKLLDSGSSPGGEAMSTVEYYLDEFTFRFQPAPVQKPGKLFYRLVQQAVAIEPVPYKSMVKCSAALTLDHNL